MLINKLQLMADSFIKDFPNLINECVLFDNGFYLDGASKYGIIIDDNAILEKEEPPNTSCFNYELFQGNIKTSFDAFTIFIHYMGHAKCDELWLKCPIRKDAFHYKEREFFEDVFIQRLCKEIVPKTFPHYYDLFLSIDEHTPIINKEIRRCLNSLMSDRVSDDLGIELKSIHYFLYNSDPRLQITFNKFIGFCFGYMQNSCNKEFVNKFFI